MIELIAFISFILAKVSPGLIGLLIWVLCAEIEKQQRKNSSAAKNHSPSKPSVPTSHKSPSISGVKPETEKRLYAMCGGDHELVRRLTHGGGQAAWEKAIFDLERDRR